MRLAQFRAGDVADTPYKRARQEWDARIGGAVVHARNWRIVAFLSLFGMLLSIGGLIYLGQQPKAVPYVIEIDKLGETTFRGPPGSETARFQPSDAQTRFHLRRFVHAIRTVSSDHKVTETLWVEAFAMASARVGNVLTQYVRASGNPATRALGGTVSIEITSEVQVKGGTWQIDWREKTFDRQGNLARDEKWRGMFNIVLIPPDSEKTIRANPIGLYVDELHWDKVGN